jgi:hypothetical protein
LLHPHDPANMLAKKKFTSVLGGCGEPQGAGHGATDPVSKSGTLPDDTTFVCAELSIAVLNVKPDSGPAPIVMKYVQMAFARTMAGPKLTTFPFRNAGGHPKAAFVTPFTIT